MGLTCSCSEWYPEPGETAWWAPHNYSTLTTKRSRKCCSCGSKLKPGNTVAEVPRYRVPATNIECRIYGEDGEIPLASHFLCERCADIFFSLEELNYCVSVYENQTLLLEEYKETHNL